MAAPKRLTDQNAKELLKDVDNVLLDCDGVIWGGNRSEHLFPGVVQTIEELRKIGKQVFLVTNNSSATQRNLVQKVRKFGIQVKEDHIVSSPYIMGAYLNKIKFKKKVYIVGNEGLRDELMQWNIQCIGPKIETFREKGKPLYNVVEDGDVDLDPDVGAVVVGFDGDFDYCKLLKASCYLSNPECLLLATNIDKIHLVFTTPYSLPEAGVMVQAVESSSGRKAQVMGKPSTLMFEILSENHNLDPSRTLMVGDTLSTDVVFGNKCGLKTLLVLSGVSKESEMRECARDPDRTSFVPTFYADNFNQLFPQ